MKPELYIANYTYTLPEERIARFPEPKRDQSKLLYYNKGETIPYKFADLPGLLPDNTLLVFNNTKVIPARILFNKESGAIIEIFCLEPVSPSSFEQCFSSTESCVWKCTVGNLKRWKNGIILRKNIDNNILLNAEVVERYEDYLYIKFSWSGHISFARIMEAAGVVPIPPYLKREADESDKDRYQTVYAQYKGSVAAPTAGLHFTEHILNELKNRRKFKLSEVTLHVGAGTFKPVKTATIDEHRMHSEPFSIKRSELEDIQLHTGHIISVGTTSARTLESLYYLGLQCIEGKIPEKVNQWEPYEKNPQSITRKEAIDALIKYLDNNNLDTLDASTQIIIAPPYQFKMIDGLITNFHQPQSTLLLLIAAFIGDTWRDLYNYALNHNFRFLSYGDSNLLIP
jgi:S-adenosylmethionine:tRNA ribosyltransferase-isomerase